MYPPTHSWLPRHFRPMLGRESVAFSVGSPTYPHGIAYRRVYRGTLLIRNSADLGPYSRAMPSALWWSCAVGQFLMSEVPLYE